MWRLTIVICLLSCSGCHGAAPQKHQARGDALPPWVNALIERQPSQSRLIVEESIYQGNRVFLVMPPNRAPDTGNEHVLHADDGRIICEFGGFVGEVTVGSCDIDGIKYVRTVFGKSG